MTTRWMMTTTLCFALCSMTIATADDWPMWGGTPARNMAAEAEGIPATFDPGKPKEDSEIIDPATTKGVKWVTKMGSQTYGNPTITQGKVLVGTNNDGRNDPRFKGDYSLLRCLDEKTGAVIWTLTVPKLGAGKVSDWEYLGICSSPAVEDNRVYLVTNRCEVICLDLNGLADGNQGYAKEAEYMADEGAEPVEVKPTDADILWRYDLRDELGVFPHNITSNSVMVIGDHVVATTSNGVDWSHTNIPSPKAPTLILLDKMTGELKGEEASGLSTRILHASWSSPAYGEIGGQGQIFFGGPDGYLYGFAAQPVKDEDGYDVLKELWRVDANLPTYRFRDGDKSKPIKYARPDGPSEFIATPVFYKGRVYAAIGQDPEHGEGVGRLVCVDPNHTGEATDKAIVWSFDRINRSISTCAIVDDLVYVADYSGFLYCLDATTGELYWKHDSLSHIWGSPLAVDGKVFIGNEDGDLIVLAQGKTKKVISVTNVRDPIYSTPVVANGVLYIGSQTQLYAIDGK